MRTGKELILATKPFAQEVRWKSWYHTISTLLILLALFAGIFFLGNVWLRVLCSVSVGLVSVRMFVINHDFQHRAILQRSALAEIIFAIYGLYILAPASIWRRSHDYHHNHNSKLFSASIGSYPIMTKQKYLKSPRSLRRHYLFIRHPITMFFAYLSAFMYGMCIKSFTSSFKKHWDALVALILHFTVAALIVMYMGWMALLLLQVIPCMIAFMIGSYLFYAQHNFPGVTFRNNIEWSYDNAALESSSYMVMNPFWRWITANIGYHHIHHINHRIPFYRLPEVMNAIPELQTAKTTTLNPSDIIACFKLKVWDPELNKMIGLPQVNS
jgi:omega-6 fatty acid desaturase (delta-12 desaturase)